MKNLFWKVFAGLMLVSLLGGSAQGQTRLATVDLRKVFDNYWRRKQADAAIKASVGDKEKAFKDMVAEYDKGKEDYQKLLETANDQAISTEERDKRKQTAEAKFKQLKETEDAILAFKRQSQATVQEQLERMRESILSEIQAAIKAKAEAGNYALVFDTAAETANKTPVFLYVNNKESDLTEAVLNQLNSTAPPDALTGSETSSGKSKEGEKKK